MAVFFAAAIAAVAAVAGATFVYAASCSPAFAFVSETTSIHIRFLCVCVSCLQPACVPARPGLCPEQSWDSAKWSAQTKDTAPESGASRMEGVGGRDRGMAGERGSTVPAEVGQLLLLLLLLASETGLELRIQWRVKSHTLRKCCKAFTHTAA